MIRTTGALAVTALAISLFCPAAVAEAPLKIGLFAVDATPPVGSLLAYNPMDRKGSTLWLKGVVLLGRDKPVVVVAVDWIGIGGEGSTRFREEIARAVGTTRERVAVHCLHQHDGPRFNLGAEKLLAEQGLPGKMFNLEFAMQVMREAGQAAKKAAAGARTVTHVGLGQAKVEKIASNRRILGPDGKVKYTRWTATRDPKIRAFPEGVIDPYLKSVNFYQEGKLLAVMTHYATHPQSYYRTGAADCDFPGMARGMREKELGVPHIHFTGAAGNIGAGKYNDGSHENRPVLAARLAKGMADAFRATEKFPVTADDLDWGVVPVSLPPGDHLDEQKLLALLHDENAKESARITAAKSICFLRAIKADEKTDITCLKLGKARVLHMPGELLVEYQLNAAKLRPDLFVAMAAYGDYAPGYIGTEIQYTQGGYETSPGASRVAPSVERVLMGAIAKLLDAQQTPAEE